MTMAAAARAYRTRGTARRRDRKRDAAHGGRSGWRIVVCGLLFVTLTALKLLLPGHLAALRGTLRAWLVRDADFTAAFSAVGRAVSGEGALGESLSEAYTAVFGGAEEDAVAVAGAAELPASRELPAFAVAEQRVLDVAYTPPLVGILTSPFGWREDPATGEETFHYGVDLAADEGTGVVCFADGTVGAAAESALLGNYVTVTHANGLSTLYAHLRTVSVRAGQSVACGDRLGEVGATGNATGPHLHFELHSGSEYLNPIYYVASAQ